MSLFSFIVSNNPLPEIDLTGFVRIKVGEFKKMNIQTKGLISLNHLDDDVEMLYAEDESRIHDLNITLCKNPPDGLEMYINKEFVYWLEGDFQRESWNEQFYNYLKCLQNKNGLQIWSIWFGDGPQDIKNKKLKLSEIKISDLDILKGRNYCIEFE